MRLKTRYVLLRFPNLTYISCINFISSKMENTRLTLKQRFKLSRFFKGETPVGGPLELTQRRVFILPTRRGLGLVLTIVLLLLMAFIYNNNLVYFLAFLLASIFFITILHTFKALAGLVVQAGYAQPVFAGESAGFQVTVSNPCSGAALGSCDQSG